MTDDHGTPDDGTADDGTADDGLVADYLRRLERAVADMPPETGRELVADLSEHIRAARRESSDDVPAVLVRLGSPEQVAAAAREQLGHAGAPALTLARGTNLELTAVLLLTAGSLVPVVPWIVGVVLLWRSTLWRRGEKLLGTLVYPFGLLTPLYVIGLVGSTSSPQQCVDDGAQTSCTFSSSITLFSSTLVLPLLVPPIVVAVLLYRRARRRAEQPPPLAVAPQAWTPLPPSPWGGLEVAGALMLGLGGLLLPVVGTVVGLVLVLASGRWTRAEKAVATTLVAAPALAFTASRLPGSGGGVGGWELLLLLWLTGGAAAIGLTLRLRRRADPA